MALQFMAQVNMFGFPFAPRYWAFCNGQLMSINQNAALFSLLGVQYGGDGVSNFALPNLQSVSPVSAGPSADPNWQPDAYAQGGVAGAETVTLVPANVPIHVHNLMATATAGADGDPVDGELLGTTTKPIYVKTNNGLPLGGGPLGAGASVPHANMQPFLVVNMCIALSGVYPSRN
jgi:microcystin-dependent protein